MAEGEKSPVTYEAVEFCRDRRCTRSGKHARYTLDDVCERPASDDAVIRENQDAGNYAQRSDPSPAAGATLFLAEESHGRNRISTPAAAD